MRNCIVQVLIKLSVCLSVYNQTIISLLQWGSFTNFNYPALKTAIKLILIVIIMFVCLLDFHRFAISLIRYDVVILQWDMMF